MCLGEKMSHLLMLQELKSITSRLLSPLLDGVGFSAVWHQHGLLETWLWFQSQQGLSIQPYRLLGDLKWNHTPGWLYWWFTFAANTLGSGAPRSLISVQRANTLWGEVLIATICATLLWTLLWCNNAKGSVEWCLGNCDFFFLILFQTKLI